MKPSIYYPLKPFAFNQHFGGNIPCVKDFGLPTQEIVSGTQDTCPVGYEKLYPKFGLAGHNGTDLLASEQPVYAAMSGTIVEQQSVPARGLGLGILTDEPYDFGELGTHYLKLRYWHLKSFNKNAGDHVNVGDIIGVSDNTGYSSGNHLHFEGQLMDKDSGGHPYVINTNNGYYGAIDIEPYFNGKYAADEQRHFFTKNLWLGQQGPDVLELQKRLWVDYSTGPGIFGPRTWAAVVKYQLANGIKPPYGFVGPITRAKLNE